MKSFKGRTISWELADGVLELELHREPCNEISSTMLEELEKFAAALEALTSHASAAPEGPSALIIHSARKEGVSAGAESLFAGAVNDQCAWAFRRGAREIGRAHV